MPEPMASTHEVQGLVGLTTSLREEQTIGSDRPMPEAMIAGSRQCGNDPSPSETAPGNARIFGPALPRRGPGDPYPGRPSTERIRMDRS